MSDMQLKYSVDMIRLSMLVSLDEFQKFSKQYLETGTGVKYYSDIRYNSYRYNFSIEQTFMGMNFSYYLGYKHNAEQKGQQYYLVIEYNPNKCYPVDLLKEILTRFFSGNFEIKSCDIAIDMDINILDLIIDKGQKSSWSEFGIGNADNRTKYFGKGSGRIKIYNKAKEQNIVDREWTRYEVSYKIKEKRNAIAFNQMQEIMNEHLPIIYTYENKMLVDPTLRAIHYAVMNGYNINELSRAYKDKIKLLIKKEQIPIEGKKIKECLRNYILLYEKWLNNEIVLFNGNISKTTKKE